MRLLSWTSPDHFLQLWFFVFQSHFCSFFRLPLLIFSRKFRGSTINSPRNARFVRNTENKISENLLLRVGDLRQKMFYIFNVKIFLPQKWQAKFKKSLWNFDHYFDFATVPKLTPKACKKAKHQRDVSFWVMSYFQKLYCTLILEHSDDFSLT